MTGKSPGLCCIRGDGTGFSASGLGWPSAEGTAEQQITRAVRQLHRVVRSATIASRSGCLPSGPQSALLRAGLGLLSPLRLRLLLAPPPPKPLLGAASEAGCCWVSVLVVVSRTAGHSRLICGMSALTGLYLAPVLPLKCVGLNNDGSGVRSAKWRCSHVVLHGALSIKKRPRWPPACGGSSSAVLLLWRVLPLLISPADP